MSFPLEKKPVLKVSMMSSIKKIMVKLSMNNMVSGISTSGNANRKGIFKSSNIIKNKNNVSQIALTIPFGGNTDFICWINSTNFSMV